MPILGFQLWTHAVWQRLKNILGILLILHILLDLSVTKFTKRVLKTHVGMQSIVSIFFSSKPVAFFQM